MTTDKLPEPGTNEKGERYNSLPIDYRALDPQPQLHRSPELAAAEAEQTGSGVIGMDQGWEELAAGAALQAGSSVLGAVTGAAKGLAEGTIAAGEELGGEAEHLASEPMSEDAFATHVPRSVEEQFGFSARPHMESAADCYKRKFGGPNR